MLCSAVQTLFIVARNILKVKVKTFRVPDYRLVLGSRVFPNTLLCIAAMLLCGMWSWQQLPWQPAAAILVIVSHRGLRWLKGPDNNQQYL